MAEGNHFEELVLRYLSKEISDSELDQLMVYLRSDSKTRRYFDKENELWQIANLNQDVLNTTDNGWNILKEKSGMEDNRSSIVIISKKRLAAVLVAASLILIAVIGASLIKYPKTDGNTAKSNSAIMTGEGEKASIILPDSTIVTLNSGTSLTYDNDYNGNTRSVKLKGEAYFDVRTNPDKPFLVQLDSIYITATGTRFNVYSYKNDNRIEATLEEGHISFTTQSDNKTFDVNPGQQAVFFSKSKETIIRNVTTETYTAWKENKLRLIDTPLEEALRKIARRYNVVFEVQGPNLLDLKYTATFIDESIEEVMQMLGTVSPISYKVYNRTSVNDKQYLKPKIVIWSRKN
ncbi:MAG TPA: FecR domain-containing protein [Bacteroidales bacterium]|nr:FecR domain-containing protein [Bacteroidales bacterium]